MSDQQSNASNALNYGPVSVWIRSVGLFALPALLSTFIRHGRYTLQFTNASRIGLAVVWTLGASRILESPARKVAFTGHGQHLDDPDSPRLLVMSYIPSEFAAKFFTAHEKLLAKLVSLDSRIMPDRINTNLHKWTGDITYQIVGLAEFARYWHRTEEESPRRLVILSPLAVVANMIPPGWAGQDIEFISVWSRNQSLTLRLVRSVLQCLTRMFRRRKSRQAGPASIGVAAVWGLDQSALVNDLFWWWDSGIPADRVLLFFDRLDTPATREVVDRAEELGIRCAVLNPKSVGDFPHLLWRAAPGPAASLRRLWNDLKVLAWGMSHGSVGRWAASRLIDMRYHSSDLEDFMVESNVRGLFHYQEIGIDYPSLACDAAGAARIGVHWSHFVWPVVAHARMHQVYFSWGHHYTELIDEVGSCVDHLLISGCIIRNSDPTNGDANPEVMEHRASLESHGATRILALFDSTLPCEGFYEFFLQRVLDDRRWGLMIKLAGNLPWEKRHLPKHQDLYEKILAEGRVQALDRRISPAEAAAAADFSVSVDINSAAIVSALAGYKSIHLDYIRLHASPLAKWAKLYESGPDKIVFDDPDKLWQKLNGYFDQPGSEPQLGVAEDMVLQEIDPFRDGQAGRRIGEYLHWYLGGLDEGLDRYPALERASKHYADRWGDQMVTKGLRPVAEPVGAASGKQFTEDADLIPGRTLSGK